MNMYCPKCYRMNDDSRDTCINCGATLRKKPLFTAENAEKVIGTIRSEVEKTGVVDQVRGMKAVAEKRAEEWGRPSQPVTYTNRAGETCVGKTFKGVMTPAWTFTEEGILFKGQLYPLAQMTNVVETNVPSNGLTNGVIQVYIAGKPMPLTLGYAFKEKAEAQEVIKIIKQTYGTEEIQQRNRAQAAREQARAERANEGLVYDLEGVRGRHMKVYENKVVIRVKATFGSLVTGNASDGEKTIYYRDCLGVQFKESGFQIGYLQLETASGIMNMKHDNFFNENSFTFDTTVQSNETMAEVADYIRGRVEAAKNGGGQTIVQGVSAADELRKFKELLDMGVLTQEEFDAKKKQLLGL